MNQIWIVQDDCGWVQGCAFFTSREDAEEFRNIRRNQNENTGNEYHVVELDHATRVTSFKTQSGDI